jgi:creatinine amidohydrolase/Fe(II)-dependent formamide hydrolase-like protein
VDLADYLPTRVNSGPWLTGYTLYRLRQVGPSAEIILPICSLGTPYREIARLGDLVLPPLFREALTEPLRQSIVKQINYCFPMHELARTAGQKSPAVRVVEVPAGAAPRPEPSPRILAFSIDTAVEQHGPHLPLSTDTIQSYAVLRQLEQEYSGLVAGPPVEYGQLTWGLPFGFSIDVTADLLREYVRRFVDAMIERLRPTAVYVAEVHGSILHRQAIVEGLRASRAEHWAFRWLYDPLGEYSTQRKDQHAGGVETALVERADPALVDTDWWPARIDELARHQMPFEAAVELSPNLPKFIAEARAQEWNGIVGDIQNYHRVDADQMFARMLEVARADVESLLAGKESSQQNAGQCRW